MSTPVFLTTIVMMFGTILAIFAMRYHAVTRQARSSQLGEDALRALAEKTASTQADSATALSAIQSAVADIRARLAAVEAVLKEV